MADLEKIGQYGTVGWSAIHDANIDKLNIAVDGPLDASHGLGTTSIVNNTGSQSDPSALTSESITDSSTGTATQTVSAVSGTGDDTTINSNFASIVDDYNKLRSDVDSLRVNVIGIIDYIDSVRDKLNELLTELRKTGGCGVLND